MWTSLHDELLEIIRSEPVDKDYHAEGLVNQVKYNINAAHWDGGVSLGLEIKETALERAEFSGSQQKKGRENVCSCFSFHLLI